VTGEKTGFFGEKNRYCQKLLFGMFELVPTKNEIQSEVDILVQEPKLLAMHNDKVSAHFLFCWQRKTQKCGKLDFVKVKARLEIAPTPEGIAGKKW
jgi:hypothetical protein